MPGHRPWTTDDDDALKAGHAAGRTLTAIARDLGRNPGTVSVKAKGLGLVWDRAQVQAAVHAKRVDAKARRANIVDRLYTRTETLLTRLEADTFTTLVPDGPGVQARQVLDFVPPPDERALANSMSSYLGSVERLEKLDSDNGAADARSMLDTLARALGVTGPPT